MQRKEAACSGLGTERDRNEACKRVETLLASFRDEVAAVEADERVARLEAALADVQAHMEGMRGGVVREDHAPPFPVPEGHSTH